ncbi:MAG TPA: histidine kinase [Blastocatellia bacterium]|nr:histidine kinase [Blastocatellia bacterium]
MKTINWKKWGIIFLCWTGFALFFASQRYIILLQLGRTNEIVPTLVGWLVWSYCWFTLTPIMLWLSRRFPLQGGNLLRPLAIHIFAALVISVVISGEFIIARNLIMGSLFPESVPYFESFSQLVPKEFHVGLMVYGPVLGIDQAIAYYFRYRERELQALNLETQLVQAQLDALRMQLHPHFLFNTLNSISVLMHRDIDAAERMLLQLSSLLRATLAGSGTHEIELRQELEILERYLEIEQIRFQDRLTVKMHIDPAALDALVPQFFFQPLVENAIRHGIANRESGGTIDIYAQRKDSEVYLEVRDNGPGFDASKGSLIEGVGLSNTRSRLEYLYGAKSHLKVCNAETGGLAVMAKLPFHTETMIEVEATR